MDTKRPTMGSACRYSLSDPEPAYPYFYRLRRLRRRSRRRLLSNFPFGLHHAAFCSLPVRSTKELCKGCLKHFQRPLFGASKARHRPLLNPLVHLQLREANPGAPVSAGGAGGLLRLRRPGGRREVAETVGSLPTGGVGGRLGPSVSRFAFPGGVGGTAAAASLWNKSSWASPRPVGALLRCRWRAYGGGSPSLEPLYRSRPAVVRRPWWRRMELVLPFQDAEEAAVAAVARRMDRARPSRVGVCRRRRVSIQR